MEFVVIARYRAHLATERWATWLTGQVLPDLHERARSGLVPAGSDVR